MNKPLQKSHFSLFHASKSFLVVLLLGIGICASVPAFSQISVSLSTTAPTCNGYTNGSITATVSGGWGPYNFTWNTGDSGATLFNVGAGSYSVTATDVDGAIAIGNATIVDPDPIVITVDFDNICAANGIVSASATGGTPPYTFNWGGGITGNNVTLTPGTGYSLNVTDANSCSTIKWVYVPTTFTLNVVSQGLKCYGDCDASVEAIISGGTAPFTFLWNTGATTQVVPNLPAGTYSVMVTDANGCVKMGSVVVSQPTAIVVSTSVTNSTCGSSTGSATASATGGVPPYTYEWSTGQFGETINFLGVGTYTVTVTDANNCKKEKTVAISNQANFDVSLTITNATCGATDGSATAVVTGGTGPFTYAWSNGANTPSVSNLPTGPISVTVTDAIGCSNFASGNVNAGTSIHLTVTSTDATCGIANGTATATVTVGAPPYTYTWSNGSHNQTITLLSAGTYFVTVVDANGCSTNGQATVNQTSDFMVTITGVPATCGQNNGSATAQVMGGSSPYTYNWSNGQHTSVITNLAPNTYNLIVIDATGCTANGSVNIQNLGASLSVQAVVTHPVGSCNAQDGEVSASASGGSGPYSFVWSNGQSGAVQSGLGAGAYVVTATDANGCSGTATVSLNSILGSIGDFVWNDQNQNGIQDAGEAGFPGISVKLFKLDNTGNYVQLTIHITDANGHYQFDNLDAGTYKLTFTNLPTEVEFTTQNSGSNDDLDSDVSPLNGMITGIVLGAGQCDYSRDAGLFNDCDQVINPGVIAGDEILCGPGVVASPIVEVSPATGGSGAIEYMWMFAYELQDFNSSTWFPIPNSNSPNYSPGIITDTTYFVRCVRRVGCSTFDESNVVVKIPGDDAVASFAVPNIICVDDSYLFTAQDNGPGATYSWDFDYAANPTTSSNQQQLVSFNHFGTYQIHLTVTKNGCTSTSTQTINVLQICMPGLISGFNAQIMSTSAVQLKWNVTNEMPNNHFEIERSLDGTHFNSIVTIPSQGSNLGLNQYTYTDYAPKKGHSTYRVKLVGANQLVQYSQAKDVMLSTSGEKLLSYPNPASDQIQVQVLEDTYEDITLELYNDAGQQVYLNHFSSDVALPTISLKDLPQGVYVLKAKYNNEVHTIKIVKL